MKKRPFFKLFLFTIILAFALTGCSQETTQETPKQQIKLGVLPIEDNLPLIVAQENGYFSEENLDVELVTFQSAVESQSAIQSGQIDGMITDMVVTSLLNESGFKTKMTSITLGASNERRRFAVIASPKSNIKSVQDLKGKSIGISNNSIIEYITDKLLIDSNVDLTDVEKTAVAKIPVRLEMLLNDQLDTAVLPEPLVTFAEFNGAKVIVDDTLNTSLSDAVITMTEKALSEKDVEIKSFYKAYNKAVKEINKDPNQFKELFVSHINIPKPIIKDYQVPTYPEAQLPNEQAVNEVLEWLQTKDLLSKPLEYKDLVQEGLY